MKHKVSIWFSRVYLNNVAPNCALHKVFAPIVSMAMV